MSPDDALPMWVIYDHPTDHPHHFVARKWLALRGVAQATGNVLLNTDVAVLRDLLAREGLVCMPRHEQDDPKILEVWL